MTQEIKTQSGLSLDPIGSIQDLLAGTAFQEDTAAQGHLKSLGDAFHTIGQSEEGQVMLTAMEGLAKKVHTETSFSDAVKVCFRLAKKITKNPWVQFGMFIGLFGLLVALVGHFGTMALLGTGMGQMVKRLGLYIVTKALMPLGHGVQQAVGIFMDGADDQFVEKKK